ncbi:lysoplasmalogenase [Microscilla marina]|uniref:Cytoplasmic membrane protein n=1 Tax=Microscilla marina ATCC 23134 TaxID=313606 RepID=A1ZJ71_MICM2|nr:lysoplasmalogenase [Microscilla marina]EAY29607.1 cytoplasmic membrane protein [Microscilla marina ATCC 23134]
MAKYLTSFFVFLIIVGGDLTGRIIQSETLDYIFKPLLMIWLLGFYYQQLGGKLDTFAKLIVGALVFSWGGDVSLMFVKQSELFFMVGLANFLIAHVLYVVAYQKSVNMSGQKGFVSRNPLWALPFLLLGVGLYAYLFPHLKELAVPVLVYASTIVLMAVFALNRKGCTHPISFQWVFYGALLFVVSDAIIAINKFVVSIPQAGLVIMVTYIAAQYLIVKGCIAQVQGN